MKKTASLLSSALVLILLGAAPAQKSSQPEKISITTRLNKTALWVGDPLIYTIRAIHDKDLEFVLDSLRKEELSLAPFVVRSVTIGQGEWTGDKKFLEINLHLTSYETGKSDLIIPSINLFYFKHEPGLAKKDAPAGVFQVPAAKVGLRSTLSAGALSPRVFRPISGTDLNQMLIPLILGLAGIAFLALRCGRSAWLMFRREPSTKRKLSQQARSKLLQENLSRLRAVGGESGQDRLRFYTEVAQFLRRYLTVGMEIEATGLTPEEIEKALEKAGINGSVAHGIRAILENCERVHYGKEGVLTGGQNRMELLTSLEGALSSLKSETAK